MRLGVAVLLSTLLTDVAVVAASVDSAPGNAVARHVPVRYSEREAESENYAQDLWKRRGGGGGGGRGGGGGSGGGSSGGGSSGGGSSGGGSSGGRGGGSGSGSGSGSSGGRGSSGSSSGGSTKTGSGPPPRYGGGSYYAGGAKTPYRSGSPSPSGISPFFLGAGVGALVFFPVLLWPHGAYFYPYHNPYHYYNSSSGRNESKPVQCACDPEVECGCDDDGNSTTVLNEIIGNGSYAALNQSEVMIANNTIFLNGTLPNGTTAAGGDEDAFDSGSEGLKFLIRNAGWWPVVATVCATVFIA